MTRRPGRDSRIEPGESEGEEDSSRFRVDRVFAAPRPAPARAPTTNVTPPNLASPASTSAEAPAPLAEGSRPLPTEGTRPAPTAEAADGELALRRQLSRLQRQLADAQRELANKEEELASEAQMKLGLTLARDALLDEQKVMRQRLDELTEHHARSAAIEQRLGEMLADNDELINALDRERSQHATARKSIDELMRAIEEEQQRAIDARHVLEDRHTQELGQIEAEKKAAIAAAENLLTETSARVREAHQQELADLKKAHERELAALRGELEPKVLEARSLGEERERLANEVSALRSEAARDAAEFEQTLRRETAQLEEQHLAELSARMRAHAAELNRALGERDTEIFAHQQTVRNAELRDQEWEQKLAAAREAEKKAQQRATDLEERATALEQEKAATEQRLAAATRTAEELAAEKRILQQQLDAALAEARRNELDRTRFVAFLEEGLAMLGALPPSPVAVSGPVVSPIAPTPVAPAVEAKHEHEPELDSDHELIGEDEIVSENEIEHEHEQAHEIEMEAEPAEPIDEPEPAPASADQRKTATHETVEGS